MARGVISYLWWIRTEKQCERPWWGPVVREREKDGLKGAEEYKEPGSYLLVRISGSLLTSLGDFINTGESQWKDSTKDFYNFSLLVWFQNITFCTGRHYWALYKSQQEPNLGMIVVTLTRDTAGLEMGSSYGDEEKWEAEDVKSRGHKMTDWRERCAGVWRKAESSMTKISGLKISDWGKIMPFSLMLMMGGTGEKS